MKHFTAREVAKVLEVSEAQVKSYLRMVPVAPHRNPAGEFELTSEDVQLLKTTHGLATSGVPASRIRRSWSSLQSQVEQDLPLTSFKIAALGHHVVASDGQSRWEPDSGQVVLELGEMAAIVTTVDETATIDTTASESDSSRELAPGPVDDFGPDRVAPAVVLTTRPRLTLVPDREVARETDTLLAELRHDDTSLATKAEPDHDDTSLAEPDRTAQEWFHLALELESSSPIEARAAYERALELDPTFADAHLNLGRHYHDLNELGKAEAHYREAVRHAPDDPTAHFNLGVLLEDRARKEEAILAYRQAIARDAEYADAHYNLGLLLESLGRRSQAMTHLMTARTLYGGDESDT
jgi:Tetratricopeptide repeat/TPR repeat/MerR HTH family regulatory protein